MSKLKNACLLIGMIMLLTIVILQTMKPQSLMDGWENVNMEMTNSLLQASRPSVDETPTQKKERELLTETETETETESETSKLAKIDSQTVFEAEAKADAKLIEGTQPATSAMINLNSATLEQLDILPGIGPSKARAIIEYRTKFGEFRSLEQIMEVKGIGPKLFEKMKDRIAIHTQS